jgi:DNA-directed RNA polymerase subunit M/transcription elongation factor TFIIS
MAKNCPDCGTFLNPDSAIEVPKEDTGYKWVCPTCYADYS